MADITIKLVRSVVSAKMALVTVNRIAPTKNMTRHEIFKRSVIVGNVKRDARSNVAINRNLKKKDTLIPFFLCSDLRFQNA